MGAIDVTVWLPFIYKAQMGTQDEFGIYIGEIVSPLSDCTLMLWV